MQKLLQWLGHIESRDRRSRGGLKRRRRGISLIEVLIGAFILAIGLAGLAGLVEIGRYSVVETYKADRSAACGRAVLHELKTRGIVTRAALQSNTPLMCNPLGGPCGGLTSISLPAGCTMWTRWRDDISKPGNATEEIVRGMTPQAQGQYSWLVTINPSRGEENGRRDSFEASVAVCFATVDNDPTGSTPGTHTTPVFTLGTFVGRGVAGGRLTLGEPVKIKENQWILVIGGGANSQVARWYRVVSANARDIVGEIKSDSLVVIGPDWDTAALGAAVNVFVYDSVSAVYTETISLPSDPAWNRF